MICPCTNQETGKTRSHFASSWPKEYIHYPWSEIRTMICLLCYFLSFQLFFFLNLSFKWAYLIWTLEVKILGECVYMFTISLENKMMEKVVIKYRITVLKSWRWEKSVKYNTKIENEWGNSYIWCVKNICVGKG